MDLSIISHASSGRHVSPSQTSLLIMSQLLLLLYSARVKGSKVVSAGNETHW